MHIQLGPGEVACKHIHEHCWSPVLIRAELVDRVVAIDKLLYLRLCRLDLPPQRRALLVGLRSFLWACVPQSVTRQSLKTSLMRSMTQLSMISTEQLANIAIQTAHV